MLVAECTEPTTPLLAGLAAGALGGLRGGGGHRLRPVAHTVALLRERAESRFTPPITGPRAPLTEVLVHEGDIRLPLTLALDPDTAAVRIALEFVTTGRPVGFVPRKRLPGLRLVATDLDWSWGDGADVHGRGIHLLMAACGRAAVLPHLTGAGRPSLGDRIDHTPA